ncbi:uncharacterized protein LOC143144525 [Ptiloglossa arizonensis]|uniref:uncharacterized protein LOC143144525 n=1 Tax=Ptiloglossa arizonensis TaxID=3350558 RepID=UPI003FA0F7BF
MNQTGVVMQDSLDVVQCEGETTRVTRMSCETRRKSVSGKNMCDNSEVELRRRLQAALTLEEESGNEDTSDSDEDDEEDHVDRVEEDVDDDDDDGDNGRSGRDTCGKRRQVKCVPSFKDVEESMTTFNGDDKRSVKLWISDFEETADTCEWIDIQMIIYAKRLLRGSAKLFVNYEKCGRSWKCLKSASKSEFGCKTSNYRTHEELTQRRKRNDESYEEYIYRMLDIASRVDVETDAVVRYIIDGIQDEECNKVVLYGARSISEKIHNLRGNEEQH